MCIYIYIYIIHHRKPWGVRSWSCITKRKQRCTRRKARSTCWHRPGLYTKLTGPICRVKARARYIGVYICLCVCVKFCMRRPGLHTKPTGPICCVEARDRYICVCVYVCMFVCQCLGLTSYPQDHFVVSKLVKCTCVCVCVYVFVCIGIGFTH